MKHNPVVTANAAALTIAVVYVVCAVSILLFPGLSMTVAQSWFHGLDLSRISALNVTLGSFILGLVTSTIGAWLVGYLFSWSFEKFSKGNQAR